MADWRKIEAELIHVLDAAGVNIVRESGDAYVVVLSIDDCGRANRCEAVINLKGKIECAHCDIDRLPNGAWATIRLTDLARRLADG